LFDHFFFLINLIEILEEFIEEKRNARRSSTGTKQPWYAVYFLLFIYGITGQISDQAMLAFCVN